MPLTPAHQSVAQVVKAETEVAHIQVEEILLPKLTAIKSVEDYATILKMFYGFFHAVEGLIQKFITGADLPDISQRRTSSLVLDDLKVLRQQATDLKVATLLPVIQNKPQAFGALYVLEGSTLGGKMIARMLAKNETAAIPEGALNFFTGYGEKTGPMWTGFLSELNKQHQIDEVIKSANETFLLLKSWMNKSFNHE